MGSIASSAITVHGPHVVAIKSIKTTLSPLKSDRFTTSPSVVVIVKSGATESPLLII